MKTRHIGISMLIALAAFAFACKPSVENEIKKFNVNMDSIAKMSEQFKAFKPLLDALATDAKAKWDAANKVTDASKKAADMKAVNDLVYGNAIYSGLNSYTGHIDRVKKLQGELDKAKTKQNAAKMKKAIEEGDSALAEAKEAIDGAEPETAEAGAEIIKKANGILISKAGDLERIKKAESPKKENSVKKKK